MKSWGEPSCCKKAPVQLWEPLLTIWWHLVELFVSITLFKWIYFCFRKKYIYVYSPNGIWICAMDKYLQPRWKVIHQVYDGFSGCGALHLNSWWDFLNIVSSSLFIFPVTSLCLCPFFGMITQRAAIKYILLHASMQLKWNTTSHNICCWIWSNLHYK